jgi:hypothetical protein
MYSGIHTSTRASAGNHKIAPRSKQRSAQKPQGESEETSVILSETVNCEAVKSCNVRDEASDEEEWQNVHNCTKHSERPEEGVTT